MTTSGEPTGYTADGTPWEEARPPHLPDPVTGAAARIPLPAWIFLVVAAVFAVAAVPAISVTPVGLAGAAIGIIRSVAAPLFGAGLFIRHPRARATDPHLVFGISLLVVVGVWSIVRGYLDPSFFFADEGNDFGPTPLYLGLTALVAIIGVFGIGYMALGLADARSHEDVEGASRWRRLTILVVALAILTELLMATRAVVSGDLDASARTLLPEGIALAVDALLMVAWGYLFVTAVAGSAASERPTRAWRSAAIGAGLVLVGRLAYPAVAVVVTAIGPTDTTSEPINFVLWTLSGISTLGYLALISAFFLGLPGVDEVEEREDVAPEAPDEPAPELGAIDGE